MEGTVGRLDAARNRLPILRVLRVGRTKVRSGALNPKTAPFLHLHARYRHGTLLPKVRDNNKSLVRWYWAHLVATPETSLLCPPATMWLLPSKMDRPQPG